MNRVKPGSGALKKTLPLAILTVLLNSACSNQLESPQRSYGKTLADLPEVNIETNLQPVPVTDIDKIESVYRDALDVATDPTTRHRILIRLADLEMARSENRQLDTIDQNEFFGDAITMYKELIDLNAERQGEADVPSNERLLYQLSKAYALDGRIEESNDILNRLVTEFPESDLAAEADFRQAELAFSNRRYALAEELYAKVMAVGDNTPFFINAVYMHGWSRFKQDDYRGAIPSFTEVLDRSLVEGKGIDDLSSSQRNIVNDTLHILSITFSYLEGPETIVEVYQALGERPYQHLLYDALGEFYYQKERYQDSANAYEVYVRQYPNTDHSPYFSMRAIKVYEEGGFPSLLLPAKEQFVKNYGAYSDYWKERDEVAHDALKPNLKIYLTELSSYYHAEAQALDRARTQFDTVRGANKPKQRPENSQANYLRAAQLYGEFVFTFPQDLKTPEMKFLQAEALYSAGKLPEAVDAYEVVAYEYVNAKFGAEGAYNAIIVMNAIVESMDADEPSTAEVLGAWQARKINSAISFSDYYAQDPRALPVLANAAQELFEQGDFARAATLAQRITQWQPEGSADVEKTAWLVLAHSRFELQQYGEAEWAYRQILPRLSASDPDRKQVIERIAASMYRQSEILLASGAKSQAVEQLLSISEVAPNSDTASTAHYDAINYLIELGDWAAAETQLDRFKARYPNHKLIGTLTPKYAKVYQESEQWAKAAGALGLMAQSGDPESRRTALYLAAELHERAGNLEQAVSSYRDYANNYPEPFGIATEARYHLVELYGKLKEPGKRDFWLQKLIDEHERAGSLATDRSRYLAAMATAEFAQASYQRFSAQRLSLPIKRSMKNKKSEMDTALKQYTRLMDYGVAEYVTQANHQIGLLYQQLSRDLMNSERPKGLDALALEQYEILLEEQAFPFEEKAIGIYEKNTERTQKGTYDEWVKASFGALAKLLPARYGKQERRIEVSHELH